MSKPSSDIRFWLIIFVSIVSVGFISVRTQYNNLKVIINTNSEIESLKKSDLKSIILGEKPRWSNKSLIAIALLKTNTEIGKSIASDVAGMTSNQFNKHWLSVVFRGISMPPKFYPNGQGVRRFVAENSSSIGIVGKDFVIGNEVKVLMIIDD